MTTLRIKEKFGSVLAFVLVVLFVMTLVIFAIAAMSSKNMGNVVGEYWQDRARYGAISGIHHVLTELASDPDYATNLTEVPLDGDPDVTWSVVIENNVGPTAVGHYASDNRTWIPPGAAFIRAEGKMRSLATSGLSSLATVISPQRPVFNDALFGAVYVRLINTNTVSWHPAVTGEKSGHVATNAILDNTLQITQTSRVDGDAVSGVDPGATNVPVTIDGTSSITGTVKKADENKVTSRFVPPGMLPTVPAPIVEQNGDAVGTFLPPGRYGPLQLDEDDPVVGGPPRYVTLGGGTYYFENYIDLRNNAELRIATTDPDASRNATLENPCRVYFNTSAVFYNNSRVNWNGHPTSMDPTGDTPQDPRLLQIYCVDTEPQTPSILAARAAAVPFPILVSGVPLAQMHINSADRVSFVAAGYDMAALLNGATLHGAIIAKFIYAQNSEINYDVRVKGVPLDGTGGFEIGPIFAALPPAAVPPPDPPVVAVNPPPPAAGPPAPPPPPPGTPPPPPPPIY